MIIKKSKIIVLISFLVTSCSNIKYHTINDNNFHATAPSKIVSVHCSPEDPENKNSFTYLYLIGSKRIDEFIYRRPWPYKNCLHNQTKINSILKEGNIISIFGAQKLPSKSNKLDPDDKGYVPQNLNGKKIVTWFFDRIESKDKCYSYLEQSCSW